MTRIELIEAVDSEVRETLVYARDKAVQGFHDDWKLPDRAEAEGLGDCEDFMMLAAARLLERGVPAEELYFVLANTGGGRAFDHAFLAVETPEGLWTCGDTMLGRARALNDPITPYRPETLDRWACVAQPREWRRWDETA